MLTRPEAPRLCDDGDERYTSLSNFAYRAATTIVRDLGQRNMEADGAWHYAYQQALCFSKAFQPARAGSATTSDAADAASEALDAVAVACTSSDFDAASFQDAVFTRRPGLWQRLMTEWPMGQYAQMTVRAVAEVDVPLRTVIELGAGVGATSRPLRSLLRRRNAKLVATDLSYGGSRRVDFDRQLCVQISQADAIVATNALHCAMEPARTISWIHESLAQDGLIIFAEGAPYPIPGIPWALNLAFAPCNGWFDRGGFRDGAYWTNALTDAGFKDIAFTPLPSRDFDLGGVYVARAQHRGGSITRAVQPPLALRHADRDHQAGV